MLLVILVLESEEDVEMWNGRGTGRGDVVEEGLQEEMGEEKGARGG